MLSVSLPTCTARKSIARIILATMMLLVMLSGVVPFSSLSSSHECGMACCVGKPSHMAGSCSTALDDEEQDETPIEQSDEHSAHDHQMHLSGATSQAVASNSHHERAKHHQAQRSKGVAKESSRTPRVAAQAITTPCSPECAAAASASTQVRRPRDPASPIVAIKPRPPTLLSFAWYQTKPQPKSAERRRLSRPRAPPLSS